MSQVSEGRGQWFRRFLEANFGRQAVATFEWQRVTQARMPRIETYAVEGPEFDFDNDKQWRPTKAKKKRARHGEWYRRYLASTRNGKNQS